LDLRPAFLAAFLAFLAAFFAFFFLCRRELLLLLLLLLLDSDRVSSTSPSSIASNFFAPGPLANAACLATAAKGVDPEASEVRLTFRSHVVLFDTMRRR
jgi:hypothetical protein